MSALLKNCACIIFGGGMCSIPFLNLSSVANGVTTTHSTSDSSTSYTAEGGATEIGNCSFDFSSEEAFTEYSEILNSHISFSCNSVGSDDSKIKSNWRVWIPVGLVKNSRPLATEGEKISIKTQTEDISKSEDVYDGFYENRTTFISNSFMNASIIGEWGSGITVNGSDQVYRVKVSFPENVSDPIFLKLQQ